MSAQRRTIRDGRRRRLGQNFLNREIAEQFIAQADIRPGELLLEIGAGRGSITTALASRAVRIVAIEIDPDWARQLRAKFQGHPQFTIIERNLFSIRLPGEPFRIIGSLPFGITTAILRHLLDDPNTALERLDVIVQWEVARKRAAIPPTTLLSTSWMPWWDVQLGSRIAAKKFRPVPAVDAGILTIKRREPPLLPPAMSRLYAKFVRQHWPFRHT